MEFKNEAVRKLGEERVVEKGIFDCWKSKYQKQQMGVINSGGAQRNHHHKEKGG